MSMQTRDPQSVAHRPRVFSVDQTNQRQAYRSIFRMAEGSRDPQLQLFLRWALHWEVITYFGMRLQYCLGLRMVARMNLIYMADDLRSFQVRECLSDLFPVPPRPCARLLVISLSLIHLLLDGDR
jgi:hypothetical protein